MWQVVAAERKGVLLDLLEHLLRGLEHELIKVRLKGLRLSRVFLSDAFVLHLLHGQQLHQIGNVRVVCVDQLVVVLNLLQLLRLLVLQKHLLLLRERILS